MTRHDWRTSAACLGHAPLFDATIDDRGHESPQARANRHALALAICNGCPVRRPCEADIVMGQDEGVRGGHVLRPLQVQRKADRAPEPIEHGTERGYAAHRRRGVPVGPGDACGCRRAARVAAREREAVAS